MASNPRVFWRSDRRVIWTGSVYELAGLVRVVAGDGKRWVEQQSVDPDNPGEWNALPRWAEHYEAQVIEQMEFERRELRNGQT